MSQFPASLEERVHVLESPIHGNGVFARRPLSTGAFIGEYSGETVDDDSTYVLWIEQADGSQVGIRATNELRYLNHSLQPNAEFAGPELFALRDIEPGEEITFHYGDAWETVE